MARVARSVPLHAAVLHPRVLHPGDEGVLAGSGEPGIDHLPTQTDDVIEDVLKNTQALATA